MTDRVDLDEGMELFVHAHLDDWHEWIDPNFPALRDELLAHRKRVTELEADIRNRRLVNTVSRIGPEGDPGTIAAWRENTQLWMQRATYAEGALLAHREAVAKVRALIDIPDDPMFTTYDLTPFSRMYTRDELREALEGLDR